MRKSTVPSILALLLVPLLYSPLALAADSAQVNEVLVKGSPWHIVWESSRREGTSTIEFGITGEHKLFGKITEDNGGHSQSQVGEVSGLKTDNKGRVSFRSANGVEFSLKLEDGNLTGEMDGGFWQARVVAKPASNSARNEDRTLSLPPEMKGGWYSFEGIEGSKMLYIRKQKLSGDGSSFSGEISFDDSDESCWGYHPFKGTVAKDGALTITSNLEGLCGVVVIKVPTPGKKWNGTYDAEFPDRGAIELSPP